MEIGVADGVVTLAGRTYLRSSAERMARVAAHVPGVTDVVDELVFDIDDLMSVGSGIGAPLGVA